MKREDLEKQGLSKEQIDFIMAENGKDVETQKAKTTTAETTLKTANEQLTEAGKQIESFKAMKVEDIQRAADDWKTKAETAQADAAKTVAQLKFDHALDGALTGAKAKNAKAVKALLNLENLKFNEADGSIIGLDDQIKALKTANDFLFEGETGDPQIVTGAHSDSVVTNAFTAAMRKGAGLSTETNK